jgi:DNA repair protein RecO (recombination protein O)
MLQATKGIFLHQIKYSETSIIAKIYTRNAGLKSFIIKGAKGKRSAIKSNILQPCNLIHLVADIKEKASLHYIKELSLATHLNYTETSFVKTSITLFISEVFLKSIKEEEANPALFDFMEMAIITLSEKTNGLGIFHLITLIQLSQHLGYSISEHIISIDSDYKMENSIEAKNFISLFAKVPLNEQWPINYPTALKKEILNILVKYYEVNILKTGEIKSHKILEAIL